MKKFIPVVMILLTAGAANAGGLVTKHSASVQLNVDAARSTATRIGSSFSISGSNIDTTDGSTAGAVSAGTITSGVYNPGTITATQDTAGAAFSSMTSYTAGTAGDLAGTVTSAGVLTVTAGGAGTSATGQYVSEITVID